MSASSLLERGRDGIAARDWALAFENLSQADRQKPLDAIDLEQCALAAQMSGHRDLYRKFLERAYQQHMDQGRPQAAARSAFWLGFEFASRGDGAQASAWLGRSQRSLEVVDGDCVEEGYLLLPRIQMKMGAGRFDEANEIAVQAVAVARRFGDRDLEAFAVHAQGVTLLRDGKVGEGLRHLDEAMVAVTDDRTFPVLAGIVYCSAIAACRQVLDTKRMQEWTELLDSWCARQTGLVPFLGECKVFRSELLQLEGDWPAALTEAEEAVEMAQSNEDSRLLGLAWYQVGGLRMLRGEYQEAEAAFRESHRLGRDPQPGLAELWLRQGKPDAAAKALQRALGESADAQKRMRLLPTYIQSQLDLGDFSAARGSCEDLTIVARGLGRGRAQQDDATSTVSLADAIAKECTGRMAMAVDEPGRALIALRGACEAFQELRAPYETARVRTLIALACRKLGDAETAEMELAAARSSFARLTATPELEHLDALLQQELRAEHDQSEGAGSVSSSLTGRELEVLSLVAAGLTNREIASSIGVSTRTVDRHVSNIFDKLGVSSRAAAAVRAVELGLTDTHQQEEH